MEAYKFLAYVNLVLPSVIAVGLLIFSAVPYRRSPAFIFALLLLTHGSLGIWMSVRVVIAMTPVRPILLVPSEYVMFTENIESMVFLIGSTLMSIMLARRCLFPMWLTVLRSHKS